MNNVDFKMLSKSYNATMIICTCSCNTNCSLNFIVFRVIASNFLLLLVANFKCRNKSKSLSIQYYSTTNSIMTH